MKICPSCDQTYNDESLNYCLNDGAVLIPATENKTAEMRHSGVPTANNPTVRYTNYAPAPSEQTMVQQTKPKKPNTVLWVLLILGGLVLVCGGGFAGLYAFIVATENNDPGFNSNVLLANSNGGQNSNRNGIVPTGTNPSNTESNSDLTIEKFKRLEPKMSYKQAAEILGGEGVQMSSSGSDDTKAEMYKWGGDTEFIIAMFLNDKLMTKSQSGLSKTVNESLTLEKYSQLKNGMKYEEVAAILGEGEEQSVTEILGSRITSYQWKGDGFASITGTFQNGKMTSKAQFGLK